MIKEIENKKIELSSENKITLLLESIFGIDDFEIEITREKYEGLSKGLWERCLNKVEKQLNNQN